MLRHRLAKAIESFDVNVQALRLQLAALPLERKVVLVLVSGHLDREIDRIA